MTLDLEQTIQIAGGIITAVTLWFGRNQKHIAALLSYLPNPRKTAKFRDELTLRLIGLEKILKPNGGTSLADKINQMERRTARIESRQQTTLNLLKEPFVEFDSNGHIADVSRMAERMFDSSADQILGLAWISLICFDDKEPTMRAWSDAVKDKRDFNLKFRLLHNPLIVLNISAMILKERETKIVHGWIATAKTSSNEPASP